MVLRSASPTSSPNKWAESATLLDRDRFPDGDIAQRIEELDRPLEFLVEKLAHVRRARRAAAEKDALGPAPLLLRSIKTNRARQLSVQSRHGAADQLRDPRDIRIGGFRFGATETNESVVLLAQLGRAKGLVEFFRDRRGDRTAADRNAAAEDFSRLDEKQIGRARADVDDKRRAGQLAVIETKRVVERHRRHIHPPGLQAGCLDRGIDPVEEVRLDRDQHDFDFVRLAAANELIIPDHFLDRKRHILLRLEGDDAFDFVLIDRRAISQNGRRSIAPRPRNRSDRS